MTLEHLEIDGFRVTGTTTDAEIDAVVAAAAARRLAVDFTRIDVEAEAWRMRWTAELRELRDLSASAEDGYDHDEHFTSRLVPVEPGSNVHAWTPFRVDAETSSTAIDVIVEAGVDRRSADDRAHIRHRVARFATAWTVELREVRSRLAERERRSPTRCAETERGEVIDLASSPLLCAIRTRTPNPLIKSAFSVVNIRL